MSGQQALEYGIIDRVVSDRSQFEEASEQEASKES